MGLVVFGGLAFFQIVGERLKLLSKKAWLFLTGTVLFLVFFVWTEWRIASIRSVATLRRAEDSLKSQIDKELPMGSRRERVEEFLRQNSMYTDGFRQVSNEYKPSYDGASGIIYATRENVKSSIYSCNIVVLFRFDDNQKLAGYNDKLVCNGPI